MKKLLALLLSLTLITAPLARAQVPPFQRFQVLTAQQLNAAFANAAITGGAINGTTVGLTSPAAGVFTTLAAPQFNGSINFNGLGNRITGDFGDPTVSNQIIFQNILTNRATQLQAMPNGSSTQSQFTAINGTDPNNASGVQIMSTATAAVVGNYASGSGTAQPLVLQTAGAEGFRMDNTQNVTMGGTVTTPAFKVAPVASQNQWITVTGANGGSPSIQSADGSSGSTNPGLSLSAAGTGSIMFYTAGMTNNQVRITNTASAVNYLNFTGATTGNSPTISTNAAGLILAPFNNTTQLGTASANQLLVSSGTGLFQLGGQGGQPAFRVAAVASNVAQNGVVASSAAAGSAPSIYSADLGGTTNTNINLGISSAGSGSINFYSGQVTKQQFQILDTTSTTNWLTVTGSNGGNPTLSASGGNIAFGTTVVGPTVAGGTGAASTLVLQGSTGSGTSDAVLFKGGNNGANEFGRFQTTSNTTDELLIGTTTSKNTASTNGVRINAATTAFYDMLVGGTAMGTLSSASSAVTLAGLQQGASSAGSSVTISSGAGGATSGAAGTISITVGSATSAAGSALTLTAGNGAGGTNAGGNLNLIPGTAVSTGTPGEVQINSASGFFEACWQQFLATNIPVTATSYPMFMANRAYRVKAASVYASSTATPTVDVIKDTGTTAPGAGSSVLTGVITFSGSANTRVTGTVNATVATTNLAAGDRLSLKWGGTIGSLTNALVCVSLQPI